MSWRDSWEDFLFGNLFEKKDYNQVIYKIVYHLHISKKVGGNKTQVVNDIRKIPNVTTVFRNEKGFEDESSVKAPYSVKFALKRGENPHIFVKKILRPSIRKIEGLGIQSSERLEKVNL